MSNVLIGIIGVILFIGLALAGALFLGPRFQDSSNNSKAAAVLSQTKQVADAAALYRVQEGVEFPTETVIDPAVLVPGYLKTAPSGVNIFRWVGTEKSVAFIHLPMTEESERICAAVQRQTGQIKAGDEPILGAGAGIRPDVPAFNAGCVRNSNASAPLGVFVRF